ncbi:CMRF35-like molecule 8 [Lepus europaeus]|uniref:CMRF35-like molecule 8 n=1 Tax=Lepus europaeus TaxID=9983 RepID=UPI002B4A138D|nr:CMRF35-like molecule 8 [Lepus europaeus]
MTPRGRAMGLRSALLLLWVPGCFCLSGPGTVQGTEGGSLSVQCWYEEEHRALAKFWCRHLCWPGGEIVKTKPPEVEARSGRVSIRDHPANLTFTVTLENLSSKDAGTYQCGVDEPLRLDTNFLVKVFVSPAPTMSPTPAAKTVTTTAGVSAVSSTTLAPVTPSSQEDSHWGPSPGLPVMLSLLALLLLLLVGTSLLAQRMLRRPVKGGQHSEPPQSTGQVVVQSEPYYVNLELQPQRLREEPAPARQAEVEYSTVAAPREEPHYSLVTFDGQLQDSSVSRTPAQMGSKQEPEYSVVRKPKGGS